MQHTAGSDSTLRELVAVFDDEDELHDVVDELQMVGFDHSDITVSPSLKTVERSLGHKLKDLSELEDDPYVPHAVPVDRGSYGVAQGLFLSGPFYLGSCGASVLFAAGGATLSTVLMAGLAAGTMGAALGVLPLFLMRRWHHQYLSDLRRLGGLVLWVQVFDTTREERARSILARHPARDVHCHRIEA
jgi:hypothetical protein